ncbi:hypothetical protein [Alkalibacterium sp. m-11]
MQKLKRPTIVSEHLLKQLRARQKKADDYRLLEIFQEETGFEPKL